MPSCSQVRRAGMRLQFYTDNDDCYQYENHSNNNKNNNNNTNKSSNLKSDNNNINMNDSKGDCSCYKQRHCNRLTCCRYSNSNNNDKNKSYNKNNKLTNSTSSFFSRCKSLPLFITIAVLMLAMPMIDAAAFKRSVAETNTNFSIDTTTTTTTINTPLGIVEDSEFVTVNTPPPATTTQATTLDYSPSNTIVAEVDINTENTPHVSNTQTAVGEYENHHNNNYTTSNADADVPIVNEPKLTTVESNINQTPLNVNNEIKQHHVIPEDIATKAVIVTSDFIKPKYEYSETLLNGNLEETIRNTVKNEIEFEHDIGAAAIEQIQAIADPEEREKLSDELLTIQNAQYEHSGTKVSAPIDVLTELASIGSAAALHQTSTTTESTTVKSAVPTATTDLSIYFPAKVEEHQEAEQNVLNTPRDIRNLYEKSNQNLDILKEGEVEKGEFADNEGMQNIEEENKEIQNELLSESFSSTARIYAHVPESTLYAHEDNEIAEVESGIQEESQIPVETNNPEEKFEAEDHTSVSLDVKDEGEQEKAEEEGGAEKETEEVVSSDNTKSIVPTEYAITQANSNESTLADESLNSTSANTESEINDVEVVKSDEGDEEVLSIVLDENLTATEPIVTLASVQFEDLLNLNDSDPLTNGEEVGTTLEPETVKSLHIVIKKQGVELDENIKADEAKTDVDVQKEMPVQRKELAAEAVIDIEKEVVGATMGSIDESVRKGNNGYRTAHNLDAMDEGTPIERDESDDNETDTQIRNDSEQETSDDDTSRISINNNTRSGEEKVSLADTADPTSNELDAKFEKVEEHLFDEDQHPIRFEAPTPEVISVSDDAPTNKAIIEQEDTDGDKFNLITENSAQTHITHSNSTQSPIDSSTQAANTVEQQQQQQQTTTAAPTPQEFDTYEDNTDDPDIVPILVGVSAGHGDVTASTKGSRSINTQTHHSMLLTQMDDRMAATLFETFPPQNAGQMFNDHLAAESSGGRIGKPLHAVGVKETTSASLFSGSGLIIVLCASIAFMFLIASIVAFVISFQRQRGTLDIEMQEQRCGKDNLDEEDEEVGACTKLLEIELPKPTIIVTSEETEECL